MELVKCSIIDNKRLSRDIYSMRLEGDWRSITAAGQFVALKLPERYLRRPISVSRLEGEVLTLTYKLVGNGTRQMSQMEAGTELEALSGLGNGFDLALCGSAPLIVGGGIGSAPMLELAAALLRAGKQPRAILGFNSGDEVFMAEELSTLGVETLVSTVDGSLGVKGFVTDAMKQLTGLFDYVFACGPEPMLKAVYSFDDTDGQYSFEARMACGFGACMGCSCETKYGSKRICRDGPVLKRGEIKW